MIRVHERQRMDGRSAGELRARRGRAVRHARGTNNHKADDERLLQMELTDDSPKWDATLPWPLARGKAVTKSCTKKQRLSFNICIDETQTVFICIYIKLCIIVSAR